MFSALDFCQSESDEGLKLMCLINLISSLIKLTIKSNLLILSLLVVPKVINFPKLNKQHHSTVIIESAPQQLSNKWSNFRFLSIEPKLRKFCITQGFTLGVKGVNNPNQSFIHKDLSQQFSGISSPSFVVGLSLLLVECQRWTSG